MFTTRRFSAEEWAAYRDIRLRALAEAPDAFGGTFAMDGLRPDSDWADRLLTGANSANDFPLAAEYDGELVGMAWAHVDADTPTIANVYQMWVAPHRRGMGGGAIILNALIEWARTTTAELMELSVTTGNSAAYRLYRAAGFWEHDEPEPLRPGSALVAQPMRLTLRNFS